MCHTSSGNSVISCKHLIAKLDELSAVILSAHSNVRILQAKAKGIGEPAVSVLPCHNPGLPNEVKLPMGPNSQIPKISIGRHAQRDIRAWMNTDIGIASREVVADEQFLITLAIVVDLGCRPQHHDCSAMRAAQRPLCSIRIPSFFQNDHLLFAFYPEFTQKRGGYPPSFSKIICKLFVNEQRKRAAIDRSSSCPFYWTGSVVIYRI